VLVGRRQRFVRPSHELRDAELSPTTPLSVVGSRLNGDGIAGRGELQQLARTDYPATSNYSGVLVRLGNGDGTLAGGAPLAARGDSPTGHRTLRPRRRRNLNGDGRRGPCDGNWYSHNVSVLFAAPLRTSPVAPPWLPRDVQGKAKTVTVPEARHTAGTYPVRIYLWKRTARAPERATVRQGAESRGYSTYSRYSRR